MLLLTSTSDVIQVITSAAGQIDVHASYVDYNAANNPPVAPARTNTRINTATTTTVVGSPAASTARNVKVLNVGNNHASVSNTVSVQHSDGTNVVVIEQVTLAPLERMSYIEGNGIRVFDIIGREKWPTAPLAQGSGNLADVVANAAEQAMASLFVGQRVVAGTGVLWRGRATKTAAGVAAATFNWKTGPAGTTADTTRATHTLAAQTAVVDDGLFEISAVLRALGASAVIESTLRMEHTGASVGMDNSIGVGLGKRIQVTSTTFTLGSADYLTLTCNPGAAGVWTFQESLLIPFGLVG